MKRDDVKEVRAAVRVLFSRVLRSFERMYKTSDGTPKQILHLPMFSGKIHNSFSTHDEAQVINAQLAEMERSKAEALHNVRERSYSY